MLTHGVAPAGLLLSTLVPILKIRENKNKNKNTFISEKKYNIIIIFVKYVTYNSFLETTIMGTAA